MKLPKPRQRGSNWSVSIMVHGKREYCTRDTEQECLHWAMNKLIDSNSTSKEEIEAKKKTVTTFHDLFNMYYKSHGRDAKSKKYIREQLDSFEKRFAGLAAKDITEITAQDLTHWRKKDNRKYLMALCSKKSLSTARYSHSLKKNYFY